MHSLSRITVHAEGRIGRGVIVGLMVGITFVVTGGCRENVYQPPPVPEVTVATPVQQTIVTYKEFTGRADAVESVVVRARVPGFLKSVEFEEGAPVEVGQLLYTIEPEEYEAVVKAAEARVITAQAEFDRAKADFDRINSLYEQGSAAQMEFVNSRAAHEKARGELLAAEAALTQAQLDLSYTKITAPIAGRINETQVHVGNLVGQGEATVLTTIVPWDPIHVYVTVSERDVLDYRRRVGARADGPDMVVYLTLVDDSPYPLAGVVDYADNRIDPATGTLEVRAAFANPARLLVPGTFVRVRVPSEPRAAILVPQTVMQRDLQGYFLMVLDEDDTVQRQDITVGAKVADYQVVTSGLSGDERVVTKGLQRVRPGVTVKSTREQLSAPALDEPPAATAPSTTTTTTTTTAAAPTSHLDQP